MNLEKAVIELTDRINHAGLNAQVIEERKTYLCLIASILVNLADRNKYRDFLTLLFEFPSSSWNKSITEKLDEIAFSSNGHRALFQELIERLLSLPGYKRELLVHETYELVSMNELQQITKSDAVMVYSHLLQRLQEMNVNDKLGVGFQYQDIPSFFSELIQLLVNNPHPHSIYDPYAMTGELAIHYALNCSIELVTIESLLQTSTYISHMCCIAGVTDCRALQSYGLASVPNISSEIADVAFTLLDPTTRHGEPQDSEESLGKKYKEHAFIQQLLYSLKKDGTGVIFLGKGPLHRETEEEARTFLLENNFVEAVIELPPKLITPRTISLFALILKKNRTDDLIRFIDASGCYEAVGRRNKLSGLENIKALYNSKESVKGQLSVRTVKEVTKNGALLIPSSYLSAYESLGSRLDLDKVRAQLFAHAKETDEKLGSIFSDLRSNNELN